MTSTFTARVRTALSPEWDHGFDEAFTELVTGDPDLVRNEFDALIGANFNEPPQPPASPAPPTDQPEPLPRQAQPAEIDQARTETVTERRTRH
ncbi:hypothetical protein [Actinoplanes sp. HUAS TT8]|uniref:hypothetical protein n=1 Tax=Actinoplanes sp. HUAS TT8 TaxID=3447453 RepID=UPI003F51F527